MLTRRDIPIEGGFAVDAFDAVAPITLPAEEVSTGAVGLFSYPADVWNGFVETAAEVESAPDEGVALAGFPEPGADRVLVVPAVDTDEPVVAFLRAGDEDQLEVVVADVGGDPLDPGFFERIDELMHNAVSWFRVSEREARCTYRRSVLACADRDCSQGGCGVEKYYDPKRQSFLYACVCRE